MGLFSFIFGRKKKPVAKSKLLLFLNEADEALIDVYTQSDFKLFYKYCDPDFVQQLSELYQLNKDKLFGVKKYRIREWKVISTDSKGVMKIHKTLSHQGTQLTKNLYFTLGTVEKDTWYVQLKDRQFIVKRIEEGHL